MTPRQKVEEILEAIWKADEAGEFTLGSVRRYCPEEISDGNLQDLEQEGLVIREGERIDVVSEGGFLEKQTAIRVVAVDGPRVIVAPVDRSAGERGE